jgi:alpha-ribazole phosphatase
MELWLIRHPKPDVPPGVCYGRTDVPAAPGEAEAAAQRLLTTLPALDRMRASPAARCRALARHLRTTAVEDARLLERHFGDWEGQAWDDIDRMLLSAWADDPWDFAPPGGESARAVWDRVGGAVLEETAQGGVAAWVTHQGVARAVAGALLGLRAAEWMSLTLGFGEAWRLVMRDGRWHRE